MVKTFEVYAYLDPRYPGSYKYGDKAFNYKPVYIGRGCVQQKRKFKHLTKSSNIHLERLINVLKCIQQQPIIITIADNISLEEAVAMEIELIKLIGRLDLNRGPLYNFCDGGGGIPGIQLTDEQKRKRSEATRMYFLNMTPEQRKVHGQKSKQNRTAAGVEAGKLKFQQYISSLTDEDKQLKELKRYHAWCSSYYTRAGNDVEATSKKCSNASYKKAQYYITLLDCDTRHEQSKFLIEWVKKYNYAKDGIMDRIRSTDFKTPISMRKCKKNIVVLGAVKRKPTEEEYLQLISLF